MGGFGPSNVFYYLAQCTQNQTNCFLALRVNFHIALTSMYIKFFKILLLPASETELALQGYSENYTTFIRRPFKANLKAQPISIKYRFCIDL